MQIRTLIVDDEPLARRRVKRLLADDPDFTLVGECAGGAEALAALLDQPPELLLLDVQMPEINGFDVLRRAGRERLPCVVFITAHDEYALAAFEVHAIDYLLKPVDRERFQEALRRAKAQIEVRRGQSPLLNDRLVTMLEKLADRPAYVRQIAVRSRGRVVLVPVADIDWIEASGKQVRLHANGREYQLSERMYLLETTLDPARFVRIHRSTIVNLDRVKELHPTFHGEYQVVLANGTQLTLSRGYRNRVPWLNGLPQAPSSDDGA